MGSIVMGLVSIGPPDFNAVHADIDRNLVVHKKTQHRARSHRVDAADANGILLSNGDVNRRRIIFLLALTPPFGMGYPSRMASAAQTVGEYNLNVRPLLQTRLLSTSASAA